MEETQKKVHNHFIFYSLYYILTGLLSQKYVRKLNYDLLLKDPD